MALLFWRKKPVPVAAEDCEPALEGGAPAPGHLVREDYRRGPRPALWLKRALRPVEALFDATVGEELNPVYKSGTLAVMFLVLASISGLVLIFYYRLGDPYGSMQRLQSDPWLGRWMRAFHRYTSDATVIATLLHLLRMAAEGKVWGPRALAWISGVVLFGLVLFTAYTGFVMVWDQHGLELARAGARVADLLPIFAEPLSRAFRGSSPPLPSFFFMNLFLHVALPLGLTFLLWLHTSRLARSSWLPERRGLWFWGAGILVLSVLWPVVLGPAADSLALNASYPFDPYFTFWLPASLAAHPLWTLGGVLAIVVLMCALPWLWRPPREEQPLPSHNDEVRCQGCVTCVHDCPFEAISMVPRSSGNGSALVARVDPALCVSCGLCVASCDRLSIGPADRIGTRQMAAVQTLGREQAGSALVLIDCSNSGLGALMRARAAEAGLAVVPYTLDCIGDLHPFSVHALQQHFRGVVILSCPTSACQTREGATLARRRLLEGHEPGNKAGIDSARQLLLQMPTTAEVEAWHAIQSFAHAQGLGPSPADLPSPSKVRRRLKGLALATPLLGLLGLSAAFQAGAGSDQSALRLAWRLPGQKVKTCRDRSAAELAAMPSHMRRLQDCTVRRLSYKLKVSIDGQPALDLLSRPRGAHGDSPLNVDQELPLEPGKHALKVDFEPSEDDEGQGQRLHFEGNVELSPGRAALLTLASDGKTLEAVQTGR